MGLVIGLIVIVVMVLGGRDVGMVIFMPLRLLYIPVAHTKLQVIAL